MLIYKCSYYKLNVHTGILETFSAFKIFTEGITSYSLENLDTCIDIVKNVQLNLLFLVLFMQRNLVLILLPF